SSLTSSSTVFRPGSARYCWNFTRSEASAIVTCTPRISCGTATWPAVTATVAWCFSTGAAVLTGRSCFRPPPTERAPSVIPATAASRTASATARRRRTGACGAAAAARANEQSRPGRPKDRQAYDASGLESCGGPFRPDDQAVAHGGSDRDRPLRRGAAAALERRRARRPLLPRLPQRALPVHRRQAAAGRADRACGDRRRPAVHPPPRRVRARLDARAGDAPGRPRCAARGQELARPARPADPLDGRLHRPGLGRPRHARALERRE